MNNACCDLGSELVKKKKILFESDNFFVMPTVGPIDTEGYLLICSKKHYVGICGTPVKLYPELKEVTNYVESILNETYGIPTIAFEHGPLIGNCSGGNCLDHSHLHILPLERIIMEPTMLKIFRGLNLKNSMKIQKTRGFEDLSQMWEKQSTSYFFVRENSGSEYTTEVNMHLPPQYIRQIVAESKNSSQWDWKKYPGQDVVNKTMDTLVGKFH